MDWRFLRPWPWLDLRARFVSRTPRGGGEPLARPWLLGRQNVSSFLPIAEFRLDFVSLFTKTGANAARERREFHASAPFWMRTMSPVALLHFRFRRWRAGHYRCRPHDYAIYTLASPQRRQSFHVAQPTFRWIRPQAT